MWGEGREHSAGERDVAAQIIQCCSSFLPPLLSKSCPLSLPSLLWSGLHSGHRAVQALPGEGDHSAGTGCHHHRGPPRAPGRPHRGNHLRPQQTAKEEDLLYQPTEVREEGEGRERGGEGGRGGREEGEGREGGGRREGGHCLILSCHPPAQGDAVWEGEAGLL